MDSILTLFHQLFPTLFNITFEFGVIIKKNIWRFIFNNKNINKEIAFSLKFKKNLKIKISIFIFFYKVALAGGLSILLGLVLS